MTEPRVGERAAEDAAKMCEKIEQETEETEHYDSAQDFIAALIQTYLDETAAAKAETAALSARLADAEESERTAAELLRQAAARLAEAEAENTRLRALMVDPNEEHKCLVCRQPRPAGIWEGRPNARVCIECRDAPAGKFAAEARLARAEAVADHLGEVGRREFERAERAEAALREIAEHDYAALAIQAIARAALAQSEEGEA